MSGHRSAEASGDRVRAAEVLAARLDRPMGCLGIVFLFVVLGQLLVTDPDGAGP